MPLTQSDKKSREKEGAKPLLSICIPTYNRANLLRSALASIVPQATALAGQVEVVVSDNCSEDGTAASVDWARQFGPIRYYRNDENKGSNYNFRRLVFDLAEGEYCWLFGDDDLLRDGAVKDIVDIIKANLHLDCFFVNNTYETLPENTEEVLTAEQFPLGQKTICDYEGNYEVEQWENIIQHSTMASLFTYIGSNILRTSVWREQPMTVETSIGFTSLEVTFPHACCAARAMAKRPAFYIGFPYIILMTGSQDWFSFWPVIQLVRGLEYSDLLAELNSNKKMVDLYRIKTFEVSHEHFRHLLRNPDMPGRAFFDVKSLTKRYWKYPSFWRMAARGYSPFEVNFSTSMTAFYYNSRASAGRMKQKLKSRVNKSVS